MASSNSKVALGCIGFLIGVLLISLFSGWIIMVAYGAVAGAMGWPTLGYGPSIAAAFLLSFISGLVKGRNQ